MIKINKIFIKILSNKNVKKVILILIFFAYKIYKNNSSYWLVK